MVATLAAALRLRVGPGRVFLDSSSIGLGKAFPGVIEAAVRSSAVLALAFGDRGPAASSAGGCDPCHAGGCWARHNDRV